MRKSILQRVSHPTVRHDDLDSRYPILADDLQCFAIGVITEASLPLQIENECSHLPSTYLGDIGTQAVAAEEIVEEGYAIRDNSYRIFAFPFGLGAKRVA